MICGISSVNILSLLKWCLSRSNTEALCLFACDFYSKCSRKRWKIPFLSRMVKINTLISIGIFELIDEHLNNLWNCHQFDPFAFRSEIWLNDILLLLLSFLSIRRMTVIIFLNHERWNDAIAFWMKPFHWFCDRKHVAVTKINIMKKKCN